MPIFEKNRPPSQPRSSPQPDAPPAILIADDDETNVFSVRETLQEPDVEIVCASSGQQVLKEVLRREFAVILLDVRMPDIDGYETASLIRERKRSEHIPLIFLTAVDKEVSHIFRGYSAGAVDYVFKPVDPFILRSKVAVFLNLYRQVAETRRQMLHARELLRENLHTRKTNEAYLERLQHLSHGLMTLQDVERRNLAHELHDEIGQCLTALNLNLQMIMKQIDPNDKASPMVRDSIKIVNQLIGQVRDMSLEMHPTMLEHFGIESTLEWYLDRLRERTDLKINERFEVGDLKLTSEQSTTIYRIVQSAVTNAIRHAKASNLSVELRLDSGNELLVTVADDGVGFEKAQVARRLQEGKCFGMISMRERAALVHGTVDVESKEGKGTVVRTRLPLRVREKRSALEKA